MRKPSQPLLLNISSTLVPGFITNTPHIKLSIILSSICQKIYLFVSLISLNKSYQKMNIENIKIELILKLEKSIKNTMGN